MPVVAAKGSCPHARASQGPASDEGHSRLGPAGLTAWGELGPLWGRVFRGKGSAGLDPGAFRVPGPVQPEDGDLQAPGRGSWSSCMCPAGGAKEPQPGPAAGPGDPRHYSQAGALRLDRSEGTWLRPSGTEGGQWATPQGEDVQPPCSGCCRVPEPTPWPQPGRHRLLLKTPPALQLPSCRWSPAAGPPPSWGPSDFGVSCGFVRLGRHFTGDTGEGGSRGSESAAHAPSDSLGRGQPCTRCAQSGGPVGPEGSAAQTLRSARGAPLGPASQPSELQVSQVLGPWGRRCQGPGSEPSPSLMASLQGLLGLRDKRVCFNGLFPS